MYIKNPAHGLSRQRKGSGSTQEMDGWEAEGRKKGRKEGRKRRGESAKKGQTARKGNHPYIISMPSASFKLATPDKRNPTDLHIQFGRIFMSTFSSIRCPSW